MNIKPTPKVSAGAAGGAIAIIVVWGIGLAGIEVPAEVAAAFGTVGSFAGGWLKSE